jgi:hypothetical protein
MTRDRERVQRKAAAEVDERVAQPFLAQVPSHVRIEDLLVSRSGGAASTTSAARS